MMRGEVGQIEHARWVPELLRKAPANARTRCTTPAHIIFQVYLSSSPLTIVVTHHIATFGTAIMRGVSVLAAAAAPIGTVVAARPRGVGPDCK